MEIVYNDDLDVDAIYTEPPEVNVLTDEESGDEDAEGDLNHLPPRQLLAGAEILLRDNSRVDQSNEPNATSSGDRTFQDDNPRGSSKPVTKDKIKSNTNGSRVVFKILRGIFPNLIIQSMVNFLQ